MQIRDAVLSDIDEITAIYNQVLATTTAIYNDRPATREERVSWWKGRLEQGYPVIVAIEEQSVAGFGSFGNFRPWPGYRYTVEGTVHIHSSARGRGVGTQLLDELIARARSMGKHVMVAGVDSENTASLRFLERFGFERTARLVKSASSLTGFLT